MNLYELGTTEDAEESQKAFLEWVNAHFSEYRSQREEDIDERYSQCDWMYTGGTSRTRYDASVRKHVPLLRHGKSNCGSTLFYHQVNTLAGTLSAILMSGHPLFRYEDKPVGGEPLSGETARLTADMLNYLARWQQKQDGFDVKMPEFCTTSYKLSNIFALISMKQEEREVVVNKPKAVQMGTDDMGNPVVEWQDVRTTKKVKAFRHPTVTFPYPQNIYADKYIRNIADQECVILLSPTTKSKLIAEGDLLDQEKIQQIDMEEMAWDGTFGSEGKNEDADNRDREEMGQQKNTILRWDAYSWTPVKDGEFFDVDSEETPDDGLDYKLVWTVFIGNSPEDGTILKQITGFDPDGEIPVKEIHISPDNPDCLYHTFLSEVCESGYAADAALLNAAIDNKALVIDPPMTVTQGHRIKDFSIRPGARYFVDRHDCLARMDFVDASQGIVELRNQVREDNRLALGTDKSRLGEYAGARTSATEVMRVTGSTDATLFMRNAYILGQFLPWLARKTKSYFEKFVDTQQIISLVNQVLPQPIDAKTLFWGEYDVIVDVVGQYEDSLQRREAIHRVMQILGANPNFMASPTHQTDIGELVKFYLEEEKVPVARIITPPATADSEANAKNRIQTMLSTGIYQPPLEGENHPVHLKVARAERLRWRGLEQSGDERAANLPLIDDYIRDLEGMIAQAGQGGGATEQPPGQMTPGQEAAAPMAGQMGATMGGMQ